MGKFTLRLPKSLHNELENIAKDEGVSLNQYIVYVLAQKITTEKLASANEKFTPEQARILANMVPSM